MGVACGCGRSMYMDELALKNAIVSRITYDLSEEDLAALHSLFVGEGTADQTIFTL